MYTTERFIHSDLSSENVTLGKAIPEIYSQKFMAILTKPTEG